MNLSNNELTALLPDVTPYFSSPSVVIYLGDVHALLPALKDKSIDFIFTDPPYGHNNNNGDLIHRWEASIGKFSDAAESRPIKGDSPEESDELIKFSFEQFNRLLSSGGCCACCCCGGGGPDPSFARWSLWMDKYIGFKSMVIWDKGPIGMGWHYRRSYETILVGQKKGAKCRWYDTTDRIENIIRHIPKIIPTKNQHPTIKPEALSAFFIRLHTQENDIVLDPFMGEGSTMRATLKLHRRFIGIDIDEMWCEKTARKLQQGVLELSTIDDNKIEQPVLIEKES